MGMNPITYKRLSLALTSLLALEIGLTILFSVLNGKNFTLTYEFLTTLLAALTFLTTSALAAVYGFAPVPASALILLRRMTGFLVGFVLFIAGMWVLVRAIILFTTGTN
jgi:hypothetical protein